MSTSGYSTHFETIREGDTAEELAGAPAASPCLFVAWHGNPGLIGGNLLLPHAPLVLGRGGQAFPGPVLHDRLISRRHLELRVEGRETWVHDLGSTNGSTLNGEALQEARLAPGDVIGLGKLLLVYTLAAPRIAFDPHPSLIGHSEALAATLYQVELVGPHPTTVLILGETGTGKELVARAVHEASGRQGEFVAVNCGAMPDSLLQAELFGHVKGAFSGAGAKREGLVVAAERGTLFLDEIGEASPGLQATLLRLLQEGEVRPVGSDRSRRVDVRFVAATNRDLAAEVEAGRFRADLLERLKGWIIPLPPLRERREDIVPIALHHARSQSTGPVHLSRELAHALLTQPWTGNVRELVSVMNRARIESAGEPLLLKPSWLELRRGRPRPPAAPKPAAPVDRSPKKRPPPEQLRALLVEHEGNVKALAEHLGVGRTTLYRWFRAAGIDPEDLRG
ncbi:MAG: sigma 54-dependent Fis family transcriptional regulator [Alphaproteobacteria bacterium]|nr:sigma 54-dependent Fis family transcriptional regulator [Alphaproteobacteria bacterium]